MDTSRLSQIEMCANELARAAKRLAEYCQSARGSDAEAPTGFPSIAPDSPSQAHRERRSILANVAKLQTLISEPSHFLEQLTSQVSSTPRWTPDLSTLTMPPSEPALGQPALARRIPGPRLHPAPGERAGQGRCRAYGSARVDACPRSADDEHCGISLRAPASPCRAHHSVGRFRQQAVAGRRGHVPLWNRGAGGASHGRGYAAARPGGAGARGEGPPDDCLCSYGEDTAVFPAGLRAAPQAAAAVGCVSAVLVHGHRRQGGRGAQSAGLGEAEERVYHPGTHHTIGPGISGGPRAG